MPLAQDYLRLGILLAEYTMESFAPVNHKCIGPDVISNGLFQTPYGKLIIGSTLCLQQCCGHHQTFHIRINCYHLHQRKAEPVRRTEPHQRHGILVPVHALSTGKAEKTMRGTSSFCVPIRFECCVNGQGVVVGPTQQPCCSCRPK